MGRYRACGQDAVNVLINFGQFVVQAVLTRPIAILYMQVGGTKKEHLQEPLAWPGLYMQTLKLIEHVAGSSM